MVNKSSFNAMGDRNNPRFNDYGYPDPTAFAAIQKIELEKIKHEKEENERFHKLLDTLFYLCKLAGFKVEGRIVLIDEKTGRVWR